MSGPPPPSADAAPPAGERPRGRLDRARTVAVIDVGSNSVRLVAYEGLSRALVPLFNEKALCGLGRGVATTGRLPPDGVADALLALTRYRALCDLMRIGEVRVLATAAARDASNGPAFLDEARAVLGLPIELLSGEREAHLAALGVAAGLHEPDGVVGDLGGGSLEIVGLARGAPAAGVSLRLGGLALQDASGRSVRAAARLAREALAEAVPADAALGRAFYAVGGTWRALAKLHMRHVGYPLRVLHGYAVPAEEALAFCKLLQAEGDEAAPVALGSIAAARRPLVAYGAAVLEQALRRTGAARVVFSVTGVREGRLHELLGPEERARDPLLVAARDLNELRSRSPRHGEEMAAWCDALAAAVGLDETPHEARLRRAACLLSDVSWRAHPDHRGEESVSVVAYANVHGLDHPGRAFAALAIWHRHEGLGGAEGEGAHPLAALLDARGRERARLAAAMMRVALMVSAAMPGVLPRAPIIAPPGRLLLRLPPDLAPLVGDRLTTRLRQLAKLLGRRPAIEAGEPAAAARAG